MAPRLKNLSRDFLRAVARGDLNKLKILCNQFDINDWTVFQHDVSGDTSLHIAARKGYLDIVEFLCNCWEYPEFKIDVTNKDMKRPLHEAAQFAHYDIVEFLVDNGATVDALKRADWTPLMLACTKDSSDAVKCVNKLIKAGANLLLRNKDGWMPLHLATRTGNIDIIKMLLDMKPESVSATSINGRTALHIAALHGHCDTVNFFISAMPTLLHTADYSGSLPIHDAVKSGDDKTFECLIAHGVDVKKTDVTGQTILHIAASVGNIFVINYVLKNNIIGMDCRDSFGSTALSIARRNKRDGAIAFLERYTI